MVDGGDGQGAAPLQLAGDPGWRDTTKASQSKEEPCPDILIRVSEVRANSRGLVTTAHRDNPPIEIWTTHLQN